MANELVISIPTDEADLRAEIEEQLSDQGARVRELPRTYTDLNQIKLLIDILSGGTDILVHITAIVTFLLMLKDRYKQQGKPSGITIARLGENVPLDTADEATLRRLITGDQNAGRG